MSTDARWLFLDMNSFFASCEQQQEPSLRHRPVAVVPMDADTTSVIAASYEAKAYGIRTGTNVGLAKRLCPDLTVVPVRPGIYVDYHKRIAETVESILPSPKVLSVDEMACRLWAGNEAGDADAVRIGRQVKEAIRERVGEYLFCSVGLAPNVFLAKVATELQKPNGLVLLRRPDIPGALLNLTPRDLPGIGANMSVRLEKMGIRTMANLYAATAEELRRAWGGVVGERWWYMLRGWEEADYPGMSEARRHTVSHSHVLGPEMRTDAGAESVLLRLTGKAVTRMRRKGFTATGIALSISYIPSGTQVVADDFGPGAAAPHTGWGAGGYEKRRWNVASTQHAPAADPITWTHAMRKLWDERPALLPGWSYLKVGVALTGLTRAADRTPSLFEDDTRRQRLAETIDAIHARLRPGLVDVGSVYVHRDLAPERIAFAKITDDDREQLPYSNVG